MGATARTVAALTLALVASACTGSPGREAQSSVRSADVPVVAGAATAQEGPWQARLAGVTGPGRLRVSPAVSPASVAGAVLGPNPAQVSLTGAARLGRSGAELTRALAAPAPPGQQVTLAYWDTGMRAWVSVPSQLAADRRSVRATVHHFSIWDIIYYVLAKVGTARVDAPNCEKGLPTWVQDTYYVDDLNSPLRWCISWDSPQHNALLVKVRNNRAYGVALTTATVPESATSSLLGDAGLEDFLTLGIRGAAQPATAAAELFSPGKLFLPPGAEADLTFTEDQVRAVGAQGVLVQAVPDLAYAFAGLVYDVASSALGPTQQVFAAAFALAAAQQCTKTTVSSSDLPAAAGALLQCAVDHHDEVTARLRAALGNLPTLGATNIEQLSATSGNTLAALQAFQWGSKIGEVISDALLPPASFQLRVFARAPRVLNVSRYPFVAFAGLGGFAWCALTTGEATCMLPGDSPKEAPPDELLTCHTTYIGVTFVRAGTQAGYGCSGGVLSYPQLGTPGTEWFAASGLPTGRLLRTNPAGDDGPGAVVPPGWTLRSANLSCASLTAAVTCRDASTGAAFTLSRDGVTFAGPTSLAPGACTDAPAVGRQLAASLGSVLHTTGAWVDAPDFAQDAKDLLQYELTRCGPAFTRAAVAYVNTDPRTRAALLGWASS